MPYIIGTDEAGYGPNLGPLVVGATLWQVPDHSIDLYGSLKSVICKSGKTKTPTRQISIGDSKSIFQSRGSIAELERGVLTMLGIADDVPGDLFELFHRFAGHSAIQLATEATYRWQDVAVPQACQRDQVNSLVKRVRNRFQTKDVRCCRMEASLVFPEQFNRGLADFGNKASLLSTVTCRLVRSMIDSIESSDQQDVMILCDRHGGRSHYAGLLQQELTESFVRVVLERPDESCYQWQEGHDDQRKFEARFMVKGERHLPIALASMLAKYLRELSMKAWNLFWRERIPELQPTAGYPLDAKRFKKEIAASQTKLDVSDDLIWRKK